MENENQIVTMSKEDILVQSLAGFKACKELKEAVYKRYIAEGIVFKEFCNEEEHLRKFNYTKDLPEERKEELFKTVKNKLIDKGLWQ